MELNYRITVIFRDEVIRTKFATKKVARKSVKKLKELFPKKFINGALEELKERWEVIEVQS